MKLLLIGNGKWGKNYIHTAKELNIDLKISSKLTWQDDILDKSINGVIIATPPDSHISIAEPCLSIGLPTLIEKPLALSLEECNKLNNFNIPILVNHIHLFSSAFEEIKKRINSEIFEINSINTGISNHSYSPILDYGCHDITMGLYLTKSNCKFEKSHKSAFSTHLDFKYSNYANTSHYLKVSNQLERERKFIVYTYNNTFIFDDLAKDKLVIDGIPIFIDKTPPLTKSLSIFINAINGKNDERLGIELSKKTVEILSKIQI